MYSKLLFILATKTQDYQEYFGNELITNIDQHLNNVKQQQGNMFMYDHDWRIMEHLQHIIAKRNHHQSV